ncbi:hypothetical protein [Streptomyces shenzhenensis]|uniref:hypothetical protein n=1 Tax=Streptomyces shenzhenensis TaxID=943815 RepID=UPI0033CA53D7
MSVWDAAANSLRIAVDATLIAVATGLLLALALSRTLRSRPAQRAGRVLGRRSCCLWGSPPSPVGFGFLIAPDRPPLDLRSSPVLIPIAQTLVATPLVVRAVLPVLQAIDPRLRHSAATHGRAPCGCSRPSTAR